MQVVLCGWSLQVPVELCWGARSVAASHAQSCSWRPWTLSGSSCWQLCLSLAKDVSPSSLAVLQMGSQDCSEEYNSWVRALKKKINHSDKCPACAVLKALCYFQRSCCRRLHYRMRLPYRMRLLYRMRLPCVLPSANPQGCPPFLLSVHASLVLFTRTALSFDSWPLLREPLQCMESNQGNSDIQKNMHKINPLDPTN